VNVRIHSFFHSHTSDVTYADAAAAGVGGDQSLIAGAS